MKDDALRSEIQQHLRGLHRFALTLVRDRHEAEELVQETVLKAIEGAHTWKEGRDLRRWLFAIMHNVFVSDMRRRRTRRRAVGDHADQANQADPPRQIPRIELGQALRALYTLPEQQREPLLLVSVEGLSYREASETLGIPVGTLMSRLARGREALREAVDRPAEHRLKLVK